MALTAADVVRFVRSRGGHFWVTPDGALHARPREAIDPELSSVIGELKPQIVALLRECEPAPARTDVDLAAARLLRECRWPQHPAPCGFFIGYPTDTSCRRCGGTWTQHTSINADATPAEQDA